MRKLQLLILFLTLAPTLHAQRLQIGDARTQLKKGNYTEAEKMMNTLLKDSANQLNPRIFDILLLSVEGQYGQMNEQMYRKQKVDTLKFFQLTQRIFTIAEHLDSLDMRPDRKGRVKPEYRRDNAIRLMNYRPNIFFGGTHLLRKGEFQQAFNYFELYIDCARQPLFSEQDLYVTDDRLAEAAYWACYCGYRMDDPVLTLRYEPLARLDTVRLDRTLQYTAEAWLKLNDSDRYLSTLHDGFRSFPLSNYFFPRLIDYYSAKGNYKRALAVVNAALKEAPDNELFLFAKSTVLLNLGSNQESLDYADRLLTLNPQFADAYYNAGTACLNKILGMDSRKQKRQIRQLYQRAQQYMEEYRRLAPAEQAKWAPALYRIYFNLNLGRQFDEMDKILKK